MLKLAGRPKSRESLLDDGIKEPLSPASAKAAWSRVGAKNQARKALGKLDSAPMFTPGYRQLKSGQYQSISVMLLTEFDKIACIS